MFSVVRSTSVMIVVTVPRTIVTVAQTIFYYDGPEDLGYCPDVCGFVGPDGYGCVENFMIRVNVGRVVCLGEMPR